MVSSCQSCWVVSLAKTREMVALQMLYCEGRGYGFQTRLTSPVSLTRFRRLLLGRPEIMLGIQQQHSQLVTPSCPKPKPRPASPINKCI